MTDIVNTATIKVVADASGVEAGLRPVDDAVAKTGKNLENLGATAKAAGKVIEDVARGPGLSPVGEGASAAATKVDRATKNMAESIQRAIQSQTALAAGAKGTADNYAALARVRGANPDALKPLLEQLDEARRKADLAADAQRRLDESTKFIEGLRSRTDGIGKSASELAELRAAELGVSDAAAPMIAKMREAEKVGEGAFGKLSDMGSKLKGVVLGVAAGLSAAAVAGGALVNSAIDDLAQLDDMAQKTGASVESLSKIQKLSFVFGADMGEIDGAVTKLAKGMATVDDESNKTHKALAALGVSSKDAAGKLRDPSVVLVDVAKRLQGYNDGAGKTALINDLVGKSGANLLPFLNDLAEQYDNVTGVSGEAAGAAAGFQDQLGWMKLRFKELFATVAIDALPALNDLAGAFSDVYAKQNILTSGDGKQWADDMAVGIARVADVAALLPRIFSAVSSSFKVVGADISVASAAAEAINPVTVAKKFARGENAFIDFKKAVAERNKTLSAANAEYDALWNKPANNFEQAVLARQAARATPVNAPSSPDKEDSKYRTGNDSTAKEAEAAAKKEADAYATVITAIKAKIEENRLEIAIGETASEAQKLQIKIDQELASGKLKLSDEHKKAVQIKLDDLAASEKLLKTEQAQREVAKYITESVLARAQQSASLAVEYEMYGKSADARAIAMAGVEAETWKEKELAKLREEKKPITDQMLEQLDAETKARAAAAQATLGQTKALQYAAQLEDENKKFGLQYIADEKQRATAQLALDAETWQERIALAGAGTEAQKILQQNFDTWYRNQSAKPFLDEQKRTWDGIESAVHDTFLSIENGAKSAADRAKQALKNGLFEWLWQLALKPIYLDVRAAFTSAGPSIPGAGDEMGSAASAAGASGPIGAAQAASNLYGLMKNGGGMEKSIANGTQTILDKLGLSIGDGAPGQAAQWAGKIGGTVGGYMIGSSLNSMISGQYQVGSGFQTVEKIGTAVASALGGPIGGAIAGTVGGLINRAFGMGNKEVTTTGISGTLSSGGASALSYSKWHQDGGWFRSDKSDTDRTPFSSDAIAALTNGLGQLKAVSSSFAASLGVDAASIANYAKTFDIDLGKDGKIEDGITKLLTGVGDELATSLVPNVMQFAKTGETASTVLERLAGDFNATTAMAQLLGKTAAEAFGTVGIESAAARERLVELAGSASNLTSWASSYAQNYLTEDEKLAPVKKAVDEAMSSLGLAGVTTRDQFKQVVNSLDLTSEAGAKQFTAMMQLADAFAQVHAASTEAADAAQAAADLEKELADQRSSLLDQLNQLVLTEAELSKIERDKLGASNRTLFDQVQAAKAVQDARNNLNTAYQQEQQNIVALRDRMQSLSSTWTKLLADLKLGDSSPLTPQQKYLEAKTQYEKTLAAAKGGDKTAQDNYESVARAFLNASRAANSSSSAYTSDFNLVQAGLTDAATWASQQVDVAKASLEALNAQVAGLIDINKSVLSVRDAMAALGTAIAKASSIGTPLPSDTSISGLYETLLGRAPDAAGLSYWKGVQGQGYSTSEIANMITKGTEYQSNKIDDLYESLLGRHADSAGLAYWQDSMSKGITLSDIENMIKQSAEYQAQHPSVVYSAASMRAVSASAAPATNGPTGAQVQTLIDQISGLRKDQQTQSDEQKNATLEAATLTASAVTQGAVKGAETAAYRARNMEAIA